MKHSTRRINGTNQTGFTLIEMAVVITVIGILAVFAVRGFAMLNKSKGSVEAVNITDTLNSVQTCFSKATDFTGLGASTATGTTYSITNCDIAVSNPPASNNGTTITNQFGGSRTVARASINGGTNNAVVVSNPAVPRDVCADVVQGLWDTAHVITLTPLAGAAVNVKTSYDQRYAPDAIAPCKAATSVTVDITRAKNG